MHLVGLFVRVRVHSCVHRSLLHTLMLRQRKPVPLYLCRVILILSFNLCLGLPSSLFSSCLHTKTLYVFLFSPVHVIFLALIILILFEGEYQSWSCSLCSFSPPFLYTLPLRPKFFPHHSVLEHSESLLLSLETKFHRHKKWWKTTVLGILICMFLYSKREDERV